MGVLDNLTEEIKNAMRSKDTVKLESLRAIKSAVLLAETSSGSSGNISDQEAIKLLQRLVKQRKDSAAIFKEQNRLDLAEPEEAQAEVIASFLPIQLTDQEVESAIATIIESSGAEGMKDMGKVMGMASKQLAGKADGKRISNIVKEKLGA
ncbi:MAG: GatB/YqeY domain-containing protein [Flavobacteriaceae bacterium]|mgnify:FL=1|nr:GatB/YqeY domain-containing protein [Flavobacteriaceae bacterium]|tara:strand:- start:198 stop:650 length:453 start_codon:yes stop_codon:yes gene_type:complete